MQRRKPSLRMGPHEDVTYTWPHPHSTLGFFVDVSYAEGGREGRIADEQKALLLLPPRHHHPSVSCSNPTRIFVPFKS